MRPQEGAVNQGVLRGICPCHVVCCLATFTFLVYLPYLVGITYHKTFHHWYQNNAETHHTVELN